MLTQKTQAEQLYNEYLKLVIGGNLNETYHNKAKQCAIIAVDLLIYENYKINGNSIGVKYWEGVKNEIIKMK